MAFDAFLKIEGIEGESTDKTHPGEIEVMSYSWGVTQTGSAGGGGGGGGAGRAVNQDFHFTTAVSKASPSLMLACATGRHFPSVLLTLRKAGGTGIEFVKIRMDDLLVSSYQTGGAAGGGDVVPIDQVSLNFVKIDFTYTQPKTGEVVEATFDFRNLD